MTTDRRNEPENTQTSLLTTRATGSAPSPMRMISATASRAIRFPVATISGFAVSILSYLATAVWVPANQHFWSASFLQLVAGTALFLCLVSFLAFDESRIEHVSRHFRAGTAIALAVSVTVVTVLAMVLAVVPDSFTSSVHWQYLSHWWPAGVHGLGIVSIACVLPAFFVAWPLSACTGMPLTQSIGFVWRHIQGPSSSSSRLDLFLAIGGWLLLTAPGAGLLVPTLFAHLSMVLFDELVTVQERQR